MTIAQLLDKYEPRLAAAFQRAINEVTSKAQIGRIAEALERGDINAAIEAVYLDESAFREFERVLQDSYLEGGDQTIDALRLLDEQGQRFVVRFNARNLRAEQYLRQESSRLITSIVQEQREVIRENLQEGLSRGDNPRTTALDVIGRVNRRTGAREGGAVGLSSPQEKAARNARQALIEGRYADYLRLARRDKRFDRTIAKAIREDKPLTKAQIEKIITRYRAGLLKLRGDTIARTETLTSLHKAQYEALQQLIDSGKIQANQISLMWDAARDGRTRIDHLIADGQLVKFGEMFTVGGRLMKHPGDPAGGPDQVINCRCHLRPKINYMTNLR